MTSSASSDSAVACAAPACLLRPVGKLCFCCPSLLLHSNPPIQVGGRLRTVQHEGETEATAFCGSRCGLGGQQLAVSTPKSRAIIMSVFEEGTALVGKVKSADGTIQTKELLEVCRSILPIVGELGGAGGAAGRARSEARSLPPHRRSASRPPAAPLLRRQAGHRVWAGQARRGWKH